MSLTAATIPIEVHLEPHDVAALLRSDVRSGLTAPQKCLSPTWLYDERGCALFEAITKLPEYYQTRVERSILAAHGHTIAELAVADTLVELGSGTSEKTRLLLDAMRDTGTLKRFVAFDVAAPTLRQAGRAIASDYPDIEVSGVVGDFGRHLDRLPTKGTRTIAFLGSTIGNLRPRERATLLGTLASGMRPGESLLLGTDLVKDATRLVAAYDDRAGVTRDFNLNVLRVMNRELSADFDEDKFEHVAHFDAANEWIEMRLRSKVAHNVHIADLDLDVAFAEHEHLLTEISAKFRPASVKDELAAAGLQLAGWWTDPDGDFAVSLAVR